MDSKEISQKMIKTMQRMSKTAESRENADSARGEFLALNYLYEKGSVALPSELSAEMNVSTARVATLLNSLEGRGLVVRTLEPTDRRKVDVRLTEDGVKRVEVQRCAVQKRMERLVEALGQADAEEYLRITDRIIEISAKENVM